MRRGGTRRELTERVTLRDETGAVLEGWVLNISRGGVRVILETKVELGAEFDVTVGEEEAKDAENARAEGGSPVLAQRGRIVWLQEETDGVIAGVEFVGGSGTHRSAPPPPPSDVAPGAGDGNDPASGGG